MGKVLAVIHNLGKDPRIEVIKINETEALKRLQSSMVGEGVNIEMPSAASNNDRANKK